MRLPKKVEVCPITDAVVELRFTTNVPEGALFGLVYRALADDYPTVENLPILQLPEHFRQGAELQFQPHHKLTGKQAVVQLGPRSLSISSTMPYVGWSEYSKCIYSVIEVAKKAKFMTSVSRLGLRYINMFDSDVFEKINIKLLISDSPIHCKSARLRTMIEDRKSFHSLVQVFNDVTLKAAAENPVAGSGIDIDVSKEFSGLDFLAHFKTEIENAHLIEKEHFYRLVQGPLLEELNPTYD